MEPISSRGPQSGSIFSFQYYMWFFDVDTKDVFGRCLLAVNPFNKAPFLDPESVFGEQLENGRAGETGLIAGGGYPDLYGPFWICTTLIFVLFFASTVVGLLFSFWQQKTYEYRFDLLTGAAGLMYSYTFIVPAILWLVIRYFNMSPTTTLIQLICLYGYSNITWIPVAILSISPLLGAPTASNIIRWVFITIGFAFSGSFIGKNLYMVLIPRESANMGVNKKPALILLVCVLLVHTAFALSVKILFFAGVKFSSGNN